MAKLYTRLGDCGFTETLKEKHIPKSDSLICLIGTLDEFSAALGVAKAHLENGDMKRDIDTLQELLISIMGELAGGKSCEGCEATLDIEGLTDKYSGRFDGFSVPGVNKPSAYLNLARCVVRRAERIAAELLEEEKIRRETYCSLNRFSDLIYAMSRYAEEI